MTRGSINIIATIDSVEELEQLIEEIEKQRLIKDRVVPTPIMGSYEVRITVSAASN